MRYLLLISCLLFSSNTMAQDTNNTTRWEYSEMSDHFTDELFLSAGLSSVDGNNGLKLSCKVETGQLLLEIMAPIGMKPSIDYDLPNIEYRFDKHPSKRVTLMVSLEGITSYIGTVRDLNRLSIVDFYTNLMGNNEILLIRFGTDNEKKIIADFNIVDPKGIAKKVISRCLKEDYS